MPCLKTNPLRDHNAKRTRASQASIYFACSSTNALVAAAKLNRRVAIKRPHFLPLTSALAGGHFTPLHLTKCQTQDWSGDTRREWRWGSRTSSQQRKHETNHRCRPCLLKSNRFATPTCKRCYYSGPENLIWNNDVPKRSKSSFLTDWTHNGGSSILFVSGQGTPPTYVHLVLQWTWGAVFACTAAKTYELLLNLSVGLTLSSCSIITT